MYAVIETGGKQYRVSPGQTVEVELLPAEPGATVTLERVLLVSSDSATEVGTPVVPNAAVVATVIGEGRGKKLIIFKYKSKKRYRRTTGHRQDYTYLAITDIQANGESLVAADERRRYERIATRAANHYERRLFAALGPNIVEAEELPADAVTLNGDETELEDAPATVDEADTADEDTEE